MIGATVIGELSWALENLLNQITNGLISASPAIHQVSRQALESYPALVEKLKAGLEDEESSAVAELRSQADQLSKGEGRADGTASGADELPRKTAEQLDADRQERFQPLRQTMAKGLDQLIQADHILSAWTQGGAERGDLEGILADLGNLERAGGESGVGEIVEISKAFSSSITILLDNTKISADTHEVLNRAYELLLQMLDSVASSQMVADVPETLLSDLTNILSGESEQQLEEIEPSEEDAPTELERG